MQYPLPHHLISRLTGRLTRVRQTAFKDWMIRSFIRRFGVDMSEAAESDPAAYPTFNAFFTRALRAGARPVDAAKNSIVSPVDGAVSQAGVIHSDRIFQAKGQIFSALELLGGSVDDARLFDDGSFATLYLSPRDYHRIHMPVAGNLRRMLHVPGRLFSVNPPTTRAVPRLFARNERVVSLFDTDVGPLALVMVGAMNVASIETVWAGIVTPPPRASIRSWDYKSGEVRLAQGAEAGRFNMGSTVILLFAAGRLRWEASCVPDAQVRMGRRLATRL
ncbi:MAG TPA: archaetidylserine decarboxylase [Gammaproteobacteria bacterium]|nr:archaetidylserine decarboxylase [Gammaproteobacteria bacterium]